MDRRPIGVFDSGLGGLTCVRELMKQLPYEDVIYFGDTGRVPYGTRSRETIIKYVRQDIRFLESFDIKAIIIACGTASSAALPWLAEGKNTKIMGVVEPAAYAAVRSTKNKRIGVVGTGATVKYGKYVENIKNICPEAMVFQKACPMFVPLVENGYTKGNIARQIAEEYLNPIKEEGVDTLILGCTHYPLLTEEIQKIMGDNVTLINAGAETALAAKEYLEKADMLCDRRVGDVKYYVSDSVDGFADLGGVFLEKKIQGDVYKVDIEKY